MATVFAGPGAARHLADFGADVVKVESPAGDGVRRMGWFPPEGGDSYTWKLLGRNKRAIVLDLKTDAGRDDAAPARRLRRRARRELPPGHDRAARARSRRAARRATPASSCSAGHRLRPGRAVRVEAGLRDDRRGDERLRRDQRRARRRAAAAADRADRRGRRARGRVRGDGRAARARPQRRRAGRRREPARVDAPDDVGVAVGGRAPRLRAAAPRFGNPVLGAAWHLSVRRRQVDRDLDVDRVGRAPRARSCSATATTRGSRPRSSVPATARSSTRSCRRGSATRPSAEVLAAFDAVEAAIAPVYSMHDLMADPHVRARGVFVTSTGS